MTIKKGPRQRQPHTPTGTQIPLNLNEYQISYDSDQFDRFVHGQGVEVIHYRAIPDPTGMQSRGDNHAVASTRSSSDGFLYKKAGECRVLFSTNSQQKHIAPEGSINNATAYITVPRFYTDNPREPILVHPWDRFYLKDVEVRVVTMQLMEMNSTGLDRLHFPTVCVELLMDANGIQYYQDKDFVITEDGDIQWISQKRPGWNTALQKGVVYSIRYRYTPFFIAARLIHEIRVAQVTDPATYQRSVERMPYCVQVVRENVYRDMNRDPNRPQIDERFQDAPPVGGATGPQTT